MEGTWTIKRRKPGYELDEIILGIVATVLMHGLFAGPLVARALFPKQSGPEEAPFVARPVVNATLLKLGKPIDPQKLPDRLVPRAKTAPKPPDKTASPEDPKKKLDAGVLPPPDALAVDDNATRNPDKPEPFPEDAGKDRPAEGHESGIDGGTETDPNKVKAGDMYAAILSKFFADRLQYPTVISQAEAKRLCATYQVRISPQMIVWYLRTEPIRKSGNELFDDSARAMLQKLLDDKVTLPAPPKDVEENFRGKLLNIAISGDMHGDGSHCK